MIVTLTVGSKVKALNVICREPQGSGSFVQGTLRLALQSFETLSCVLSYRVIPTHAASAAALRH